jgi:hypothetical protein
VKATLRFEFEAGMGAETRLWGEGMESGTGMRRIKDQAFTDRLPKVFTTTFPMLAFYRVQYESYPPVALCLYSPGVPHPPNLV